MEYALRFPESDLRELSGYTEQAVKQIRREGNSALYHGLVRRGVEVASERAKSTDSS